MKRGASPDVRIQPATAGDAVAALECVYAHLNVADRQRAVARVVDAARGVAPPGLWTAYRGERLQAAALAQLHPGRTVTLEPPRISPQQPAAVVRPLLARVIDDLTGRDVRLAQALLEVDHGPDADALRAAGFEHACDLLYLVSLRDSFPRALPREPLELIAYTPALHARLARIVERTYVGSLDCPTIDRLRDVEDVLTGYRAIGVFDPARWMIVRRDGADVGCLLLTDGPTHHQWELTYMGVVGEARGRGLGIAIVRQAQRLAARAGRERLALAVDAANTPAIDIYSAAGFVTWDRRSVFLRADHSVFLRAD